MSKQHEKDPVRYANAVIAAAITLFFFVHMGLATAKTCGMQFGSALEWIIWVGILLIVVHVALSLRTTVTMFTDTVRPASKKKRRHQWLKWITGTALTLAVIIHVPGGLSLPFGQTGYTLSLILCAAALSWHVWVGSKSLTRDLDLPLALRYALRVVACLAFACVAVVLLR